MMELKSRVLDAKAELDAMRPLAPGLLASLQKHYDVELTYTSNAIEGNTLTLRETAEVIEHGFTVGGKRIAEYLEALDHYDALQWMRNIASQDAILNERTVTELHRRIVLRSNQDIAGLYSEFPRRIAGSHVVFPNARKIPELMANVGRDLGRIGATPEAAFDMHERLTAIHPFADGNGRTARLLMNLILLRGGYPPIAIRPEDRPAYLTALETASIDGDKEPFQRLMLSRLADTLDDYVRVFKEAFAD